MSTTTRDHTEPDPSHKFASSGHGSSPRERGLLSWANTAIANPLLAYGAIAALQLRVIWNVWLYKDLTPGDTSSYFTYAVGWAHGVHDNIVWSPLYTDFWGAIIALFKGSVYTAAMVHRVAIVLASALLVLALMRSLLGPAIGLLVTVWWTLVPVNFNVLYEVHLFGLLPTLIAALIVARRPRRRALGTTLGVLAGTTLLLRNELLIATLILAAAIFAYEIHERRLRQVPVSVYLRAYGVPLAIVCLLAGGAYWRSYVHGHRAAFELRVKQDLNVCQAYAYNYQQRHPMRFTGNAFTECQPLMRQVFGHPEPGFLQAIISNPRAIGAFVLWNARLLLSGLQVALFNATSTGDQPDYIPVETQRPYALILSLAVLTLLLAGVWAIYDDRGFWQRDWLPSRVWAVTVLGAVAVTTLAVILTERPRPEYMYSLTVGLLALVGVCLSAVLRRVNGTQFAAPAAICLTLGLIFALPSYYHRGSRSLHDAVDRLGIVSSRLQKPGSVLIASAYNFEICAYLAATHQHRCTSPPWQTLQAQLAHGVPISYVLDRARATVLYVDSSLLSNPQVARLVADPKAAGWQQVAGGGGDGGRWLVLVRLDHRLHELSQAGFDGGFDLRFRPRGRRVFRYGKSEEVSRGVVGARHALGVRVRPPDRARRA